MHLNSLTGVLLINLGTPADPSIKAVRKYLTQFLSDPRVVELPYILRKLLLHVVILPFRSKKSAHAYASIWQQAGSPLLINSLAMCTALQQSLGSDYKVVLGMRYGAPSIQDALNELLQASISRLIILPLFPQYASAANGSALQQTLQFIAARKEILPFTVINDFYKDPGYIQACAANIQPYLKDTDAYVLMSYHGLPERQLINPGENCYKTKCFTTAALIADQLALAQDKWGVSFQSRLGKLPWIKPYTEDMLIELRSKGIDNLLVTCPSFVADCLETLEEIGLRAQQQWLTLGGTKFTFVPSLNANATWIKALQAMVKKRVSYDQL